LKANDNATAAPRAVSCSLAAQGRVRVPVEALPELRRRPGPVPPDTLPTSFLKHADEQTIAGLAAVYHAIADHGLAGTDFSRWGVLAAPRFLGRNTVGAALTRFDAEGAWGVSPHLIPHRTLHSISGTVSHALKIHGPNYGVGGGPGAVFEVLLAAAALLDRQQLPGIWVVLTLMDPELPPIPSGQPVPGTFAVGQTLALVPLQAGVVLPRLQVSVAVHPPAGNGREGQREPMALDGLQELLDAARDCRLPQAREVEFGGRIEVHWPAGVIANGPGPRANGPHGALAPETPRGAVGRPGPTATSSRAETER
jgi:hypothetical protein